MGSIAMGQIVGGIIAIALLASLAEWALIKRVMDDPAAGGVASVAVAYVLAVVLYGFVSANGNGWQPSGIIAYLPGALVVGFWFWRKGVKQRDEQV
jgi:hypothetical protein